MQTLADRKTGSATRERADKTATELAEQFQALYPRLYNYLRYRVNAIDDAEDLLGQVFERAYSRRTQFDPAKGALSTWLFRIAHNLLVDHYRAGEKRATWEADTPLPADLTAADGSPETEMIRRETIGHLLHSLSHLSDRDQEIISLKFAGRLKNKEIGDVLDMKEKTVSVALLRAMRRLRQHMEAEAAS